MTLSGASPPAPHPTPMQTFLPFKDFKQSAQVLDRRRLGKQRSETKQLVEGHLGIGSLTTRKHPASIMWRGFLPALIEYGIAICEEWRHRGYVDFVLYELQGYQHQIGKVEAYPPWLGHDVFHASHRGRLMAKEPSHYRNVLGWTDDPFQPYLWPIRAGDGEITYRIGTTGVILRCNYWGDSWDPQSNPFPV